MAYCSKLKTIMVYMMYVPFEAVNFKFYKFEIPRQ